MPNPTIEIKTGQLDQYVRIEFSDNGPGIDPKIKEKIFEPFFTTKAAGTGTGLGLSLSYDIITQGHQGLMEAGSSKTGGATILILLPKEK